MKENKLFTSSLISMALIVSLSCAPHSTKQGQSKTGTYLGIFKEKFRKVIDNSDGKIDVQIDLGHRDGSYVEGDEPYLFVTSNKSAHFRLLYITTEGALLQKFPPIDIADQTGAQLFVNDFISAGTRYRIPQPGDPYKYVVKLGPDLNQAQELVIAIASTVPFASVDSLIQAKKARDPRKYTESAIKSNIVNLGILFQPEAAVLKWAPYVFDLFAHVFIHTGTGYSFGYNYKVINISK